jgi:AraC-like DNA-binding protein
MVTTVTPGPRVHHDRSSRLLDRSSEHADDRIAPDALSEVLQDLRLSGVSYCRTEVTAPWGIEIPAEEGAVFHFVAEGGCWLRTASLSPQRLEAGDMVLLPRGAGHALVDVPDGVARPVGAMSREPLGERTFRLRGGGGGTRALLVCCDLGFEDSSVHPLLQLMPEVLLVRGAEAADPSLVMLLETMAAEIAAQRIGGATVMARLADTIITRVIRGWVETRSGDTTGWLTAIRDPQIGRALAAIHRRPEHAWSVTALADVAGMSRSLFSERFTAVVGASPAQYVTRWRMHLARTWLRAGRVSEVAARLGYQSEAAFSRAFKRAVGHAPSEQRRAARF